MATYTCKLAGDIDSCLQTLETALFRKSVTASRAGASDFNHEQLHVAVRVYERYSTFSSNRVSLNLTLVQGDGYTYVSAITAGGSRATFFKLDTVGEETFLLLFKEVILQNFTILP
ncbi:MAG: DUF6054 family protein [Erysipelotrichaceae bacterium]